jgi:hypothetical protein
MRGRVVQSPTTVPLLSRATRNSKPKGATDHTLEQNAVQGVREPLAMPQSLITEAPE